MMQTYTPPGLDDPARLKRYHEIQQQEKRNDANRF